MKRYICLIFILLSAGLCLVSCGRRNERTDVSEQYIGYWECDKLVVNGEDQGDSFMGTGIPLATFYNLTLGVDSEGSLGSPMSAFGGGEEDIRYFTWDCNENSVTLKGEGNDDIIKLDYSDEHLVMNEVGEEGTLEVCFTKVDRFSEFDFEQWAKENYTSENG